MRVHEDVGRLHDQWADEVLDIRVVDVDAQKQTVADQTLVAHLEGGRDHRLGLLDVCHVLHELEVARAGVEPPQHRAHVRAGWGGKQTEQRARLRVLGGDDLDRRVPEQGRVERQIGNRAAERRRCEGRAHAEATGTERRLLVTREGEALGRRAPATHGEGQPGEVRRRELVQEHVVGGRLAERSVVRQPEAVLLRRLEDEGGARREHGVVQHTVVVEPRREHEVEHRRKPRL